MSLILSTSACRRGAVESTPALLTRVVIRLSVLSTASTVARSSRLPRSAAITSTLRPARLPSPDHFGFLMWIGITDDEVRRATYFEPVYQTVMRSSLRDPENFNPKTVIVPDRQAAEFIQGLFPGSKVQKLDIDLSGIVVRNRPGR